MNIKYSKGEDLANSITHFLGAGLSIAAIAILAYRATKLGNAKHVVSFVIFGVSLLLLYTMSAVYHLLPQDSKARKVFKILDHSAIYVLISGSYTPYLLTIIQGISAWVIFGIQWGLTTAGILFKIKFAGRFKLFSTIIYLIMGWMIVFVFKNLKTNLPPLPLNLLIASGITYSVGTIFYMMKKVPYTHAIWHLFVMGGSILNFLSVFYSVS
jgi:hemolysin III